ncbi:MAG: tetratricopeptide repeat protein [Bacillota bacterium]
MAFMNKKKNKYVFWVLVGMISIGLVGPVSIGYWTNYSTSQSQAGTATVAGEAKGHGLFEDGIKLLNNKPEKAADKFKLAITEYEAVLRTSPKNTAVLGNLATSYFYTGNTDKAIETVKKALEIDPNFSQARMNYAIYLGNGKGQTQDAIKELQKIKVGDPNYQQAQQLMASFSKPAPFAPKK